jgi:hypothetical protein
MQTEGKMFTVAKFLETQSSTVTSRMIFVQGLPTSVDSHWQAFITLVQLDHHIDKAATNRYSYADTLLKEDVITVTIANLCMNQGRDSYADTLLKEDVITVTIANLCMNQGRDVSRGERREVVGLVAQGERSGLPTQEGWNEDHTCSETFHYCGRVQYFDIFHFCGSIDRALSRCFLSLGQVSVELSLF